jgi:hypothetical protein
MFNSVVNDQQVLPGIIIVLTLCYKETSMLFSLFFRFGMRTAKKPCRNFTDSDVDNGGNRPIYHGVENVLHPGSCLLHPLST